MVKLPKAAWIALAVIIGAGAFLIGPAPDKGPRTSDEAVAASEADTITMTDPVHERPFDVSTWTPTEGERDHLVVISHGFSGDRTSHSDLALALVGDGYTVAAPTHPDLAGLESDDSTLDPLTLRPRHLSLTIDAMEAEAGQSFDSVTVVGFSMGAYSALRISGAQPVLDGSVDAHCDANADFVLCNDQAASRFETLATSGDDFTDTRVDHIVLLAPGYGPLFGSEPISVDADILVVAAEGDTDLPGGQVDTLIGQLPDDTESSTVAGGHFVFMRPCTAGEAAAVPAICDDPDGVDRVAIHADLADDIVEFIEA